MEGNLNVYPGRVGVSSLRSAPTGLCELGQATSLGPRVSNCHLTTGVLEPSLLAPFSSKPPEIPTDTVLPDPCRRACPSSAPSSSVHPAYRHSCIYSSIHTFILLPSTHPPARHPFYPPVYTRTTSPSHLSIYGHTKNAASIQCAGSGQG